MRCGDISMRRIIDPNHRFHIDQVEKPLDVHYVHETLAA